MRENKGFTLIEIMVVVILLGMIAAAVIPDIMKNFADAKGKTTKAQLDTLKRQIQLFYFNENRYPKQEEGLAALTKPWPNHANSSYLEVEQTLDPWNNPIVYTTPGPEGKPFDLVSLGADKKRGGDGENKDLSVWDAKSAPPK